MSDDLTANPVTFGQQGGGPRPLSSLYREIDLAAVAIELNLQFNTLEPDVAEAIERGAAALFHSGYGPSLIRRRRSVRARDEGSGHKVRRGASNARQSRRLATGKPGIELRGETEGIRVVHIGAHADLES